jgi:hypothetical protein
MYILNTKKRDAMEINKNCLEKAADAAKQKYEGLTQGVEMLESFFKEYYDQISDFDPWIDARLNVLKELKKELSVSRDLEDPIHTAYRKAVLMK